MEYKTKLKKELEDKKSWLKFVSSILAFSAVFNIILLLLAQSVFDYALTVVLGLVNLRALFFIVDLLFEISELKTAIKKCEEYEKLKKEKKDAQSTSTTTEGEN